MRPLEEVFNYYGGGSWGGDVPTRPWRLGAFRWATQGYVLVALHDDGSDAGPTPEEYLKGERYLTDEPTGLTPPIPVRALRVFAGEVQKASDLCEPCGGSGRDPFSESVNCEHCGQETRVQCHTCGGDGLAGLDTRYGLVHGVPLNLTLLAFALSCVPDEDSTVRLGTMALAKSTNYGPALAVIGATWRIVVMCVLDAGKDAPVFRYETVAVAHGTETP